MHGGAAAVFEDIVTWHTQDLAVVAQVERWKRLVDEDDPATARHVNSVDRFERDGRTLVRRQADPIATGR